MRSSSDSDTQAVLEVLHVQDEDGHRRPPAPAVPARKKMTLALVVLAAVLGAAYGVTRYIHGLSHEHTDNAFVEGVVVQVSPHIAGHVVRVAVKDNQHVAAGDLLVEIDPRDYQIRLDQALAAVKSAEARLSSTDVDLATVRKTAVAALEEQRGASKAAVAAVETAQVRLSLAQSMQAQARSHLEAAQAAVEQAKAETEATEAEAKRAQSDLVRYESLYKTGGITASQLDLYATLARSSAAAHRAAQRRITASEAQAREAAEAQNSAAESVRQAQSQILESQAKAEEARGRLAGADVANERVARAEAEKSRAAADLEGARTSLRQAELDLSYTRITAPQPGTVTRKAVEEGQYLRPGQTLLSVLTDEKWVVANFKETQIELMRPGQSVSIYIDAYPHTPLKGRVDSVQRGTGARFSLLPAENATGNYVKVVQRVPVKIVFEPAPPPELVLSLGMSVVPEVEVK